MNRKEELQILIENLVRDIKCDYDYIIKYNNIFYENAFEKIKIKQNTLNNYFEEYNSKDESNITYIVMSRDSSDYVYLTRNKQQAETERKRQYDFEENQGGRPSVYIREFKDK